MPPPVLPRKMPKLLRGEMKLFTEEGTQSTKVRVSQKQEEEQERGVGLDRRLVDSDD